MGDLQKGGEMMAKRYREVIDLQEEHERYQKIQDACDRFRIKNGELFRSVRNMGSEIDMLLNEIKNANIGLPVHVPSRRLNAAKVKR